MLSIDLGAGNDKLTLGAFANTATVANVETLLGGTGADTITLGTALTTAHAVDLGAGTDKLTLANAATRVTATNVETLIGGTGADTITLGAAAASASIDLGAGSDTLTFGNFANSATVSNVETITGGAGADTITLGSALTTAMSVDLGAGANKLTLADGANTGTVSNVGHADRWLRRRHGHARHRAAYNGSVDLGGGSDTLQLGNFTNSISVTNTTISDGRQRCRYGRSDRLQCQPGRRRRRHELHQGEHWSDTVRLRSEQRRELSKLLNFGTGSGDTIALDTTGSTTLGTNAYDLGGATLTSADLTHAADNAALVAAATLNGGKGAFIYQDDTGGLYYSGNGNFATGGTLVGIIDAPTALRVLGSSTLANFVQV